MTTLTAKTIGMKANEIKALNTWLTKTRTEQCADALKKWLMVGDICTRVKAAKLEGKFADNVCTILGTTITNDERQYSMKLHDAAETVSKWYTETGCMKYNPRTIWTAFQAKDEEELTPEEKKAAKEKKAEEKAEKQLRKERTGADAIRALVEFNKVRKNAGENGNLVKGDLEILKASLASELAAIEELLKLELAAE